ncbi:MAG: LLM class flavin-dependent oxidoreductase [Pseudomonadota bacterium]
MKYSVGTYPNVSAQEMVATGVLADQLGFHTMWVPDSHLLWREAYVLLGAIASQTKRIRLATAVTNPMTRHLTVTSSAFSTLDELSGGRATLGISVGDSALKTMGLQISTVDNFEASLKMIQALLQGETVDVPGGDTATISHAKNRKVPIYVASTGPRMLKLAGRLADGVVLMNGVAPDLLQAAIDKVHEGAREVNRDPAEVKVVVWAAAHANDENPRESLNAVKYNIARAILRGMPGEIDELTRVTAEKVKAAYNYAQHGSAEADFASLIPDELVPRYAFAGTGADIKKQAQRLEGMGIDEIAFAVPDASSFRSRDEVIKTIAANVL